MEKDFNLLEKQCYNIQNNFKSNTLSRIVDDSSLAGSGLGAGAGAGAGVGVGGLLAQRQIDEIYGRLEDRFQEKVCI